MCKCVCVCVCVCVHVYVHVYMFWYMLGPTPADASKIVTLTSGTCKKSGYLSILDNAECSTLAAQLKTPGSTAYNTNCKGGRFCPVGCYKFVYNNVNNGKLYFNTNLKGSCTKTRQCLCKGKSSLLVYVCMHATF